MALALATSVGRESRELPREFSDFRTIRTSFEPELAALFFELIGRPRPCFTPETLEELRKLQILVRQYLQDAKPSRPIRYLVGSSGAPGGVNFGGDLDFFVRCLRRRDEFALTGYARMAIDLLYDNLVHLDSKVTTIAVVRGPTLGAAFEAALSCDAIFAAADAKLGFPEVLFNLFPGMGAYPLLARRISPSLVERMIISGKQYSARQLHEMGVIDVVSDDVNSGSALLKFIQQMEKTSITRAGVLALRDIESPVSKDRLLAGVDVWVDSMLNVSDEQLSRMESLLRLQRHREFSDNAR